MLDCVLKTVRDVLSVVELDLRNKYLIRRTSAEYLTVIDVCISAIVKIIGLLVILRVVCRD